MNQRKTTTEVLDRADQQQGTKKTMVSTRRGVEVVTVNKEEMEALRKSAKEDAKKKRKLEKMAQEQKRLQLELEKMQSALEAAKEREKNATMAIIPTNRKIKKENLNDDLVQHTMAAAKLSYFVKQNLWKIFSRKESWPKTSFLIWLWICLSQRRNSSTITRELCTMASRPHARMFSQTPRKGLKVCVLNKLI